MWNNTGFNKYHLSASGDHERRLYSHICIFISQINYFQSQVIRLPPSERRNLSRVIFLLSCFAHNTSSIKLYIYISVRWCFLNAHSTSKHATVTPLWVRFASTSACSDLAYPRSSGQPSSFKGHFFCFLKPHFFSVWLKHKLILTSSLRSSLATSWI